MPLYVQLRYTPAYCKKVNNSQVSRQITWFSPNHHALTFAGALLLDGRDPRSRALAQSRYLLPYGR